MTSISAASYLDCFERLVWWTCASIRSSTSSQWAIVAVPLSVDFLDKTRDRILALHLFREGELVPLREALARHLITQHTVVFHGPYIAGWGRTNRTNPWRAVSLTLTVTARGVRPSTAARAVSSDV